VIANAVFEAAVMNRMMDVNSMQSFQRCTFRAAYLPNNTGLGFTFMCLKRRRSSLTSSSATNHAPPSLTWRPSPTDAPQSHPWSTTRHSLTPPLSRPQPHPGAAAGQREDPKRRPQPGPTA
jgi:hypothetical protein